MNLSSASVALLGQCELLLGQAVALGLVVHIRAQPEPTVE